MKHKQMEPPQTKKYVWQATIKLGKDLVAGDRILVMNKFRNNYRTIVSVVRENDYVRVFFASKIRYSYEAEEEVIVFSKGAKFISYW